MRKSRSPCRALAHGLRIEHCSTVRTSVRKTVSASLRPAQPEQPAQPRALRATWQVPHVVALCTSLLSILRLRLSLPLAAPTTAVSFPPIPAGGPTNHQPTLRRMGFSSSRLASSTCSAVPSSLTVWFPRLYRQFSPTVTRRARSVPLSCSAKPGLERRPQPTKFWIWV